jgi:hypothetical protein
VFSSDFNFLIVATLTAIGASGLGVLFASIALIQMASEPEGARRSAMLSFSGTIPCNIGAFLSSWVLPRNFLNGEILGVGADDFVISFLLFISFILLMVTLGLLYDHTGPGTRALKVGSISLTVLYGLGCVGMLT